MGHRWLAVLLLVLLTGCSRPGPAVAPEPEAAPGGVPAGEPMAAFAGLKPADVEFVRVLDPLPTDEPHRPLFGARPEDRVWLEQVLAALEEVRPADATGLGPRFPRRATYLEVRLNGGRRVLVRSAYACVSHGNSTTCSMVPGRLVMNDNGAETVVTGERLERFLKLDVLQAMPRVSSYRLSPDQARAGGRLALFGDAWAEGKSVRFELEQSGGGARVQVGETEVTFGAFAWSGRVPEGLAPGDYTFLITVTDGGSYGVPFRILQP